MGDRAEDIFNNFKLSKTDAVKFNTVLDKHDNYFMVKKMSYLRGLNSICASNSRGKMAASFIHKLAES